MRSCFSSEFSDLKQTRKIEFLVFHHIADKSIEEAIATMILCGVSSHFIIDEDGKIFHLVDENDVAYHAGKSFWRGVDGLNKNSIGIEFFNPTPFEKKFSEMQLQSGLELARELITKYGIKAQNIVGHSDIAYDPETKLLDRKQDPSHLFDWEFFAKNGVGIHPKTKFKGEDAVQFAFGDRDPQIKIIKQKLSKFGYLVNSNFSPEFDVEMQHLIRVFNRRFNSGLFAKEKQDCWMKSSDFVLTQLSIK